MRGFFRRASGEEWDDRPQEIDSSWDILSSVPFGGAEQEHAQEVAPNFRQQSKILKAFENSQSGRADLGAINGGASLDIGEREKIIDMMARGAVGGLYQERQILEGIHGPINYTKSDNPRTQQQLRSEAIMIDARDLVDKHDRRILGAMTSVGFGGWESAGPDQVLEFIGKYPTPMDFEQESENFLEDIKAHNSPAKYAEYCAAMEKFKKSIYGKKQEYWEQMKLLRKEVSEIEPSGEWLPGEVGLYQTSRGQAKRGELTHWNIERGFPVDGSCENMAFVDKDNQTYGVFDGAGGMGHGRQAAEISRNAVETFFSTNSKMDGEPYGDYLGRALDTANLALSRIPEHGCSTGTLARVVKEEGVLKLAYATVGDSRIYIINANGDAWQITKDEGEGKYITNAIGNDSSVCCVQKGTFFIREDDRIVICSDGITGDYGSDLMSVEELGQIVAGAESASGASKLLIERSRKIDDKTALVFSPKMLL